MVSSAPVPIFDNPMFNGLGGLSHGSLFRVADSVDISKPPGSANAKSAPVDPWRKTVWKIATFQSFLYSPNLTWFLMACVVWQFFPYPLEVNASSTSSVSWQQFLKQRLLVNHLLAFGYIGFWHVTLYGLHWCHRPFVADRIYNIQKVLHNMFYTMWGVFHWTAVELAFVYCYQTGRLQLLKSESSVTTASEFLTMLAIAMLVPSFRDVHFYFCHRMIHLRWLYKYIHSLHHRNTDVEPFSGLAMHPVEHLYYFTCYAPFLFLQSTYTPFLVFWMGFHTALSPAASHSGWEDHFSADLTHYLHHRYCDCNYGAGINFDAYFGTYQSTIKGSAEREKATEPMFETHYMDDDSNGAKRQKVPLHQSRRQAFDSKATLDRWWCPEHVEYQFGVAGLTLATLWAYSASVLSPLATSVAATMGPALWALLLALPTRQQSLPWRKALLAPFDKDPLWSLILHFGLGILLGVCPATSLLWLILKDA